MDKAKWVERCRTTGLRINLILTPKRDSSILDYMEDFPYPDAASEVRSLLKKALGGAGVVQFTSSSSEENESYIPDITMTEAEKNVSVEDAANKLADLEF